MHDYVRFRERDAVADADAGVGRLVAWRAGQTEAVGKRGATVTEAAAERERPERATPR